MSEPTAVYEGGSEPRVSKPLLLSITWALCGVASVLVIVRLGIRKRCLHQLFIDDYLSILAFLPLLGNAGLVTAIVPTMYEILLVNAGGSPPSPDYLNKLVRFENDQYAFTILFWTTLWIFKANFLAVLRVNGRSERLRVAWWIVALITLFTYIGCIISHVFAFAASRDVHYQPSEKASRLSLINLDYSAAADSTTSALIVTLFISLGTTVDISAPQKLWFAGVASLGVAVAIFAVVRAVSHDPAPHVPELSWLTLWATVEASVAVIAGSLTGFGVLLGRAGAAASYVDIGTTRKPETGGRQADVRYAPQTGSSAHSKVVAGGESEEPDHLGERSAIKITRTFSVVVRGHMSPTTDPGREEIPELDSESREIATSWECLAGYRQAISESV